MALQKITITDLSRGGAGVGKLPDGRTVFIPFTAPGDEIEAKITRDEKRYAWGEAKEFVKRSPERLEPPCPVFGICGGCQWQHLPYEAQWKTKSEGVRYALERVGVTAQAAWDMLPAAEPYGYRNRVQFRATIKGLGYFKEGSREIVPIDRCPIARAEINERIPALKEEARARLARGEGQKGELKVEVETSGKTTREAWNSGHGAFGFRQVNDAQNEAMRAWIASQWSGRAAWVLDLYGGSGNLSWPLAPNVGAVHCVDIGTPRERPQGTPSNLTYHRSSVLIGFWPSSGGQAVSGGSRQGARPKASHPRSAARGPRH